jgi:hypothetical protein
LRYDFFPANDTDDKWPSTISFNTSLEILPNSSWHWTRKYCSLDITGTNSMELSSSSEASGCEATQEFFIILREHKFDCHVDNSPPLDPILSQINRINIIPSYRSKIRLYIIHPPTSWSS